MIIIPYKHFSLDLPITAEQAAMRLAEATDPRKVHTFMPFNQSSGEFLSTFSNGGFRLQRANTSRHAISVHGRFTPVPSGSRLEVTFSILGSGAASVLSFCIAILVIGVVIKESWLTVGRFTGNAAASIGIVVVIYMFVFLAWKAETRNVSRFFYLVYLGRSRA
jgi:hypothetical protein